MKCPYKTAAVNHQIQYFKDHHNIEISTHQPNIPLDAVAQKGIIFYLPWEHFSIYMNKHYSFSKRKNLYKSFIKSTHIKFNFFIPLMYLKRENATTSLISSLIKTNIIDISSVQFEYGYQKHRLYQHFKSSFDVYILATSQEGKRLGIGCKIKYVEGAGSTEKQLISYNALGEAMQKRGDFDEFLCILFYPSGNTDQEKAITKLKKSLPEEKRNSILPIHYEQFIDNGFKMFNYHPAAVKWLDYLQNRYIPTESIPDHTTRRSKIEKKISSTL